jgi:DNA gyrase subunit A
LERLLNSRERVLTVVEEEASEIVAKFGTKRRTAIVKEGEFRELRPEDVIPNSSSLVVYSRKGFIKRMAIDTFSVQGRGGQGTFAHFYLRI